MEYRLSPECVEDLQSIWQFIAADNAEAADKLLDQFFDAFENLSQWPKQGHRRADLTNRAVRFWPLGKYLVVYRETRHVLEIVAVLHGARDIPTVIGYR